MHGSVLGWFMCILRPDEVRGKRVLEVGSLNVNGTIRPMVEVHGPADYVGVDLVAGPGVDRVADAEDLPKVFGPDSFDVVVCCEMMEHTTNWKAALTAMLAVLRPGGVLVLSTRSPGFPFHHPPDRWRYTQAAFGQIAKVLRLDQRWLTDDPELPGVFWKVRLPEKWKGPQHLGALDDVAGVTPVLDLRVLWLPSNPDGCGYYRMWQPAHALQRAGAARAVIPPPGQHFIIPTAPEVRDFHVLVQQRPTGQAVADAWEWYKMAAPDTRLVYETDDNIFEADTSLQNWQNEALRNPTLHCLGLADAVTVSTEPLADAVRLQRPDVPVTVLPNRIHADLLTLERPRREQLTVVWAGGANHERDVVQIQEPLRRILVAGWASGRVGMHWIGEDHADLVGTPSRFTPFQHDVWDYYGAIDGDIAVIPLKSTPMNDCRSHIKALEMAALGIPVVASDVEPYRGFVQDGVTGFLARSEYEWHDRLATLITDAELRAQMGKAAREAAAAHTIQAHVGEWVETFLDLVDA